MATNPWDPALDFLDPIEDWAPSRFKYQPDVPEKRKSIFKPWVREVPGRIGEGLGYLGTGLGAYLSGDDPATALALRAAEDARSDSAPIAPDREALKGFALGLGPYREPVPGDGVRLPEDGYKAPTSMEPEIPDGYRGITPAGRSAVPPTASGQVDVTIDGKTYSYGGGQRGGANGPAPTLDLQASGYSPSGYSTKAFGGEADRRGGRPFAVADPSGTGELGAETGASGMVKLSEDSTTPMALELKAQARQRQLDDVLFANRMKLEQELSKDPLFRERELAKIDQQKQEALLGAQGKSATAAYERARKMQASQRIDQQAQEYAQALQEKYATDPAALERALNQLQQDVLSRRRAIEADYGST